MAEDINLNISAKDDASKTIDKVADKAGTLDGTSATVDITADDNATEVIDESQTKLEELDGEQATVETDADDNASDTLETVQGEVDDLDGTTATVDAEADDNASDTLAEIQGAADDLDGLSPEITPTVDDSAVDDLQAIEAEAENLDGLSPEITPQVDSSGVEAFGTAAETATGQTGLLDSAVTGLAAKFGLPALSGATAAGAGIAAAGAVAFESASKFENLALQVENFAKATGTNLEEASRMVEVVGDLGVDAGTAESAIGRMNKNIGNGTIDLAGFGITAGTSSENFVALLNHLNNIPDAAEQAAEGGRIFGKGWQGLAPLLTRLSEFPGRLQAVSDEKLQTADKIKAAHEFQDAMDSLHDAIEDVELALGSFVIGPITDAAAIVGNLRDDFEQLKDAINSVPGMGDIFPDIGDLPILNQFKQIGSALGALREITASDQNPFEQMRNGAGELANALPFVGDKISDLIGGTTAEERAAEKLNDKLRETKEGNNLAAQSAALYAQEQAKTKKQIEESTAANAAYDQSLIDNKKHLLELADAEKQRIDDARAAADSTVAVSQATDKEIDFLAGLSKEVEDANGNQQKLNDINREAIGISSDRADALNRQADDQAKATGTTVTATQKQDIWNNSMIDSANNLTGPMQDAVLTYIGNVNQIPPEKISEIKAAIAAGDLEEAKRLLAEASATRHAAIVADADTAQANKDIDYAARDREVALIGRFRGGDFVGPAAGLPGTMAGGPVRETGFRTINEAGAETVLLPGGSQVLTAGRTMQLEAGQQPSVTHIINLTVKVDPLVSSAQTGREIANALDAYYRTTGSRQRAIA